MPPRDPKTLAIDKLAIDKLAIDKLAKFGHFDELKRRAEAGKAVNLANVFDRAVADFRSVKRNAGHGHILRWCVDQGLDPLARTGWSNEPVICLAAAAGNNDIVEYMRANGIPDDPRARASVGDAEFLKAYARQHKLSDHLDENGFNLLFYCAQSGLGRRDDDMKVRLTDVCRLLIDEGVDPAHEAENVLPLYPAYLCSSCGGNEEVMRLLLDNGGLMPRRFHQTIEHALEPHQRSGEPYYTIAELILKHGLDINQLHPHHGRTLLHGSANRGTIKAVQWLLQNGANPNALDVDGRTPLHVCAQRNPYTTVVKLLIDAGSAPNAKDATGRTPLDYARENKRAKVAEYLASIGGR